jgi:hypothetical protein
VPIEPDRLPLSPDIFTHANSEPVPVTHPLREREGGEPVTGKARRLESDRRLRIRTAGLIVGTRAQGFSVEGVV